MYAGVQWDRLRSLPSDQLLDIGLILEVSLDETPVTISVGPMKRGQLIEMAFGTMPVPEGYQLPEIVWFMSMQDKGDVRIGPGPYARVKQVISTRLSRWEEFAAGLFKEARPV